MRNPFAKRDADRFARALDVPDTYPDSQSDPYTLALAITLTDGLPVAVVTADPHADRDPRVRAGLWADAYADTFHLTPAERDTIAASFERALGHADPAADQHGVRLGLACRS